jgi:hypothetical protein
MCGLVLLFLNRGFIPIGIQTEDRKGRIMVQKTFLSNSEKNEKCFKTKICKSVFINSDIFDFRIWKFIFTPGACTIKPYRFIMYGLHNKLVCLSVASGRDRQ